MSIVTELMTSQGDGAPVLSPSPEIIAENLAALPGGPDSFAILARDEMTYLQTAGGGSEPFVLEYQAGSLEEHYAAEELLSLAAVTQAFQLYAAGDESWHGLVTWKKEDLASSAPSLLDSSRVASWGYTLVVLVILALLIWWGRGSWS